MNSEERMDAVKKYRYHVRAMRRYRVTGNYSVASAHKFEALTLALAYNLRTRAHVESL